MTSRARQIDKVIDSAEHLQIHANTDTNNILENSIGEIWEGTKGETTEEGGKAERASL